MAVTFTSSVVQGVPPMLGKTAVCGEVINAGHMIYLDPDDDNRAKIARAYYENPEKLANVAGMALNSTYAAGQPLQYAQTGLFKVLNLAGFNWLGHALFLGAGGKVERWHNVGASQWVTQCGWGGPGDKEFTLNIRVTGLQIGAI